MGEQQDDSIREEIARVDERHSGDRVLDTGALRALAHPPLSEDQTSARRDHDRQTRRPPAANDPRKATTPATRGNCQGNKERSDGETLKACWGGGGGVCSCGLVFITMARNYYNRTNLLSS